jgi:hypothetical protein
MNRKMPPGADEISLGRPARMHGLASTKEGGARECSQCGLPKAVILASGKCLECTAGGCSTPKLPGGRNRGGR